MVSFSDIINDKNKEKRNDNVKELIGKMEKLSVNEDFENAALILNEIKEHLELPDDYDYIWTPSKMGDIQTLEDINEILKSNSIRLNPKHYNFYQWLDMLLSLDGRKSELQGISYKDIERKRKIVAEEMLCLGLTVPKKKRGMSKMPNRKFLETAHSIHPDICRQELGRRERVKLWKALEKDSKEEVENIKKEISKYIKE